VGASVVVVAGLSTAEVVVLVVVAVGVVDSARPVVVVLPVLVESVEVMEGGSVGSEMMLVVSLGLRVISVGRVKSVRVSVSHVLLSQLSHGSEMEGVGCSSWATTAGARTASAATAALASWRGERDTMVAFSVRLSRDD
jgi:hypothetical protein